MTGTAKVKPPKNDAEFARNVQKRLNSVENPQSARVGDWVLFTDPDTGSLVAANSNGGAVTLADRPVNTSDADEVNATGLPHIRIERQINQAMARGVSTPIVWDTVVFQSPQWGYQVNGQNIAVPQDGHYLIVCHVAFLNSTTAASKAMFLIDGVVQMAQETDPSDAYYPGFYMVEVMPLSAGAVVSAAAFQAGSGTYAIGPSAIDVDVHTSLTITRLPIG